MFAALRAELLILRKSRVAWVLVAIAPLLTLISVYLFQFLEYIGDTPALYYENGTPAQNLPALLPSQFVIQAVGQLYFTAPFIVLGAVMAGGDWSRGTISTSLLARAGRARVFAGQATAILIACAVSVLASFGLAAVASVIMRWYAGPLAPGAPGNGAFPAWSVIIEALGAGLVIGISYGALGIALGTACRSAAGGVAAALVWYFLADEQLYGLSLDTGGVFQHIYNAFPLASVVTLTSMFGSPGGGADSATYQPVGHWASVAILLGYTALFLVIALVLVRRRDIPGGSQARIAWPRLLSRRPAPAGPVPTGSLAPAVTPDRGGVLACARAELLVMSRWPAMWAFVLATPLVSLFDGYLQPSVLYANAGQGSISLATPAQVLPNILPGQYVAGVLNSIGLDNTLPGTAAFFLIGALAAGTAWHGGTIKTALLQAPSRVRATLGQALAVAVALVVSVALTFAVAGAFTLITALTVTGSLSPAAGPLPGAGRLAAALGAAVLVSLSWGALGRAAGTVLRSAVAAFAVILLWTQVLQGNLSYYAILMPRAARAVYDVLPNAATDTAALLFGQVPNDYGGPLFTFGEVAPAVAFATLAAYALACFTLPVLVTRRRDIN